MWYVASHICGTKCNITLLCHQRNITEKMSLKKSTKPTNLCLQSLTAFTNFGDGYITF